MVLLRVPRTLHLLLLTPWTAVVAGAVVPAAQPPGVPSQQGHGRARTQLHHGRGRGTFITSSQPHTHTHKKKKNNNARAHTYTFTDVHTYKNTHTHTRARAVTHHVRASTPPQTSRTSHHHHHPHHNARTTKRTCTCKCVPFSIRTFTPCLPHRHANANDSIHGHTLQNSARNYHALPPTPQPPTSSTVSTQTRHTGVQVCQKGVHRTQQHEATS